jgi:hypothetical protein
MPVADPNSPDTAVRVQSGDTLSSIAKANGLTLSEIKSLNPTLMNNPKYDSGNKIFTNTKVNIAPKISSSPARSVDTSTLSGTDTTPKVEQPSDFGITDSGNAARLAAEEAARKAAEDAAAKEAADAEFRRLLHLQNLENKAERSIGTSVSPTPTVPTTPTSTTPPPPPIKTAAPDIILFDDLSVSIEVMTDLIFENIGGQELINIARNDTINGQNIIYQPIKNLSTIQQLYNPNNIVSLQQTSEKYFQNFSIKLEEKIPEIGNGPNGSHVYIDSLTGDLVIELINILEGEQVESQISINGTIYEGTI